VRRTEPNKIRNVKHLLNKGHSLRQVEAQTGVCKSVVWLVKADRYLPPKVRTPFESFDTSGPYYCPGCERVVSIRPCVACRARAFIKEDKAIALEE